MAEKSASRRPIVGKVDSFDALHCDNMTPILVSISKACNGKRRHIRLRHKVVKELLENGVISLDFGKSEKNLADPLTKGYVEKCSLIHRGGWD